MTRLISAIKQLNLDTFPSLLLIEIEADFAVVRFSPGLVKLSSWGEKREGKVTVVREEMGSERQERAAQGVKCEQMQRSGWNFSRAPNY